MIFNRRLFGSLILAIIGLYLFVTFSLQRYAYLTASLNVGSASMFAPAYTLVLSIVGLVLLLIGTYFVLVPTSPTPISKPQRMIEKDNKSKEDPEDLLKVLEKRYSKGEISAKEYKEMKAELEE